MFKILKDRSFVSRAAVIYWQLDPASERLENQGGGQILPARGRSLVLV